MAHPVKPAKKVDEIMPRRRGNKFVMCSWERWKHIPPAPRMTAPAWRALKPLVLEHPSRTSAMMLRVVPAHRAAASDKRVLHGKGKQVYEQCLSDNMLLRDCRRFYSALQRFAIIRRGIKESQCVLSSRKWDSLRSL